MQNSSSTLHWAFKLFAVGCLFLTGAVNVLSGTASELPERLISADFGQVKGPLNTAFKECVGAGRANEGLRADWQQQLARVHKECGFT
ncbi:MAG: hypothetical protein P8020_12920, partial [Acidobacteriota bacterium]